MPLLKLYVVINQDGQYLRAKGYRGSGLSWVDKLEGARLYSRLSSARAQVTYWGRLYPVDEVPRIGILWVDLMTTMVGEDERASKAIQKSKDYAREAGQREANRVLKRAEERLKSATEDLDKMRKNNEV